MIELTPFPWSDVFIIIGLILLNGVFAMSELAIVSASTARLDTMAKNGHKGAATAIRLASNPGKFLSTVQIGITLIGILAGAYSGASLGEPVAERLAYFGVPADMASSLGFAIVIGITTYLSLVIGELVPKQIALRSSEAIAAWVAIPMDVLARVTAPVVWLLDGTSRFVFWILRLSRDLEKMVTADELKMIFAEATKSGVIEENERAIMSSVLRLADRPVREVMTPRVEVDWLDIKADNGDMMAKIRESGHSRIPVAEDSADHIRGVAYAREIVMDIMEFGKVDLPARLYQAPIVPDQLDVMDALKIMQKADIPLALVHDEYGHFEGLVTPADILQALAGAFAADQHHDAHPDIVERADGSLLVSGSMSADALSERLEINLDEDRDYATAAGHALHHLRHLPQEGEIFTDQGWQFEIIDMDGRRVDKLLVSKADMESENPPQ